MRVAAIVFVILAVIGVYRIMSMEVEKPDYEPCTEETKACVQAP